MEVRHINLDLIDLNEGQLQGVPKNPRTWSLRRLNQLAASIDRTPELMAARPPIVVEHEGRFVALCGNMRVSAPKHAGKDTALCAILAADELPPSKLKEIAVKDNSKFGNWNYDALANDWSDYDLADYGLPDFTAPASPGDAVPKPVDDREVIEIPLDPDEFDFVMAELRKVAPTPEEAVLKLLHYDD